MLVLSMLSPLDAAAQGMTPAERATLDRLCRTTGRNAPSAAALAIAATATREHETFGGHIIGRGGALVRFGAVEADVIRDEAAGRGVPWREVMRYWQSLGPLGDGPLQVRRIPRLQDEPQATGAGDLVPLGELLARLRGGSQSRPRARGAGPGGHARRGRGHPLVGGLRLACGADGRRPADPFRSRHGPPRLCGRGGAAEPRRGARADGGDLLSRLRPRIVPLRPGDLLCLHRHEPASLEGDTGFDTLIPALARGERPVWNLHCDVVSAQDARRRMTTVIGGNVLQSVARRDLLVDRRGALAVPRRPRPCPDGARIGPLCQPEAAPWFVVLQAVDNAEP